MFKHYKQVLLLFPGIACMATAISQKQIQLDSTILQNSERWIAKKQKGKPHKFYEFGPYKIIESRKTDTTKKRKIIFSNYRH